MALLAIALTRALSADAAEPTVEFHLEGGDATNTLTEFSRQAHLQLLFDYNIVKGHQTKPLEGNYSPSAALTKLLANSDLEFDFVNERTLAVTQKKTPARSATPPQTVRKKPAAPKRTPARLFSLGPSDGEFDVVRITGTSLRDEQPVAQELISAGRPDIELTGSATPAEFLSIQPQTFGGGPNQDTHLGVEAQSNSGLGVGINLRGLGARATLVLIDGRRVAPSGNQGEFVDIENIPLAAIERIDILPDSASTTYGADAVGGVVNFVTRDKLDGAETVLRGGSGTRGDLAEYLLSQAVGWAWDSGHGLLAFELYDRGGLPAADRRYATSDLTTLGGGDYDSVLSNPGNIVEPGTGAVYGIPKGQNGTHLTLADLAGSPANSQNLYQNTEIIPTQQRWNLFGSARQTPTDRLNLFGDLLWGHREATETGPGIGSTLQVPNTNAFYPAGLPSAVQVDYNFAPDIGQQRVRAGIDTVNAAAGLNFDAGAAWTVSLSGSYSREKQDQSISGQLNTTALTSALAQNDPTKAFNPFADGSNTYADVLDAIGGVTRFWLRSQLETGALTADGPLGTLFGVPLKLAVGADRRNEFFATRLFSVSGADQISNLSRSVVSGFGELLAPFVDAEHAMPGLDKLDLSIAERYESYSTYGGAATPKVGLLWSPVSDLALRGTWSRAVRPPTLADLDTNHNQVVVQPVQNASGGYTNTMVWEGGNAQAQPEHARSWTAGLDIAPSALPGLSVGVTYFNTRFTNRIQSTDFEPNLLIDPAYAAIVTENPSAAQIAYICGHSTYIPVTSTPCAGTAPGAILDLRVRNLATVLTRGVDFNARYEHAAPLGTVKLEAAGTRLINFSQAVTQDAPLASLLDTQNEPLALRMRLAAGWSFAGFGALVAANYTNSYRNTENEPASHVDSWTTIDVQLRYDFPDEVAPWLQGTQLQLDAHNVFNVDPPFLDNHLVGIGYDQENANPYGRVLSLQLTKRW